MLFKSDKTNYKLALIFGTLSSMVGILLTISYILNAIIDRIDEPDQSLLFWYLPILLIGLAALKLGLGFGIWGFINLRRKAKTLS